MRADPAVSLASRPAGRLVFGPQRWASHVLPTLKPSHLLVLRSPESAVPVEVEQAEAACLELVFNDIAAPRPGLKPPERAVIERLLAFAGEWDGRAPMLVCCYAGVSRSPAAAYAIACLKRGPGGEGELAHALRAAAPSATPNPLVIRLADEALGRSAAMVDAVEAIGRGSDAYEGEPVSWDLDSGAAQSLAEAASSTAASTACSTAPSTSPV
jgi:predicted protein tyrosine phosphatase